MIGTLHEDECHCSGQSKQEQCSQSYHRLCKPSPRESPVEKPLKVQASAQSGKIQKQPCWDLVQSKHSTSDDGAAHMTACFLKVAVTKDHQSVDQHEKILSLPPRLWEKGD
jgi:hypothetical protein